MSKSRDRVGFEKEMRSIALDMLRMNCLLDTQITMSNRQLHVKFGVQSWKCKSGVIISTDSDVPCIKNWRKEGKKPVKESEEKPVR